MASVGKSAKQKGKAFEREIANFLSTTLNVGDFTRVPNSGAYFGGKNKHRTTIKSNSTIKLMRGDIIAPDKYNIIIECKNHKTLLGGFYNIMAGHNNVLDKWLTEIYLDSDNNALINMLVFKISNTGTTFFCLPLNHFKEIKFYCDAHELTYSFYNCQSLQTLYLIIEKNVFVKTQQLFKTLIKIKK